MSTELTKEQVMELHRLATLAPPYEMREIYAKDIRALCSLALKGLEAERLRDALAYISDPSNYLDEGMLKRPGGYRKVGIMSCSAEVRPWAFAKSAIATWPTQKCPECGQFPGPQTGEYPCATCGMPRTHDATPPAAPCKHGCVDGILPQDHIKDEGLKPCPDCQGTDKGGKL